MNLKKHIAQALDLTQSLQDALRLEDLSLAQSILEERAGAMQGFQECHQAAGAEEIEGCQSELRALQTADQELLSQILDTRDALAQEINKAGIAAAGSHSPYLDDSQQACVNRKA